MPLDTLMGGLKAAHLDTGEPISPGQARRLACDAGIIPAVLGGKSQVLDLGRKNRFGSQAQRILKTIEQGGCEAEGCDAPPGMCHLHHHKRWADGGETNRDDLIGVRRHSGRRGLGRRRCRVVRWWSLSAVVGVDVGSLVSVTQRL